MSRTAPVDPRTDLVPFGSLATVEHLGAGTTRVLAPNASHMTLDGTNSYLVGRPGSGRVAVVDPGPTDPAHLDRVVDLAAERDAEITAVLLTHHHVDHAAAAGDLAERVGCPVHARSPTLCVGAEPLTDGDAVDLGGHRGDIVATPGHTSDHVAFRLPDGSLLTGDHVLGRGTSMIAAPDGDLVAYLDSLRRVLDLGPDRLLPGHGPVVETDPAAVVTYYLEHREHRRRQVLDVLEAATGAVTTRGVVEVVYADVDTRLWPAADLSTRATLDALVREGVVAQQASTWSLA